MQNRSKVINRLALVLLSIVVLELVLIGDQVQPVKAIKKKILVKKLKKILPILALIKPKKKIILVPIPIPMFNKHSQSNQFGPHGHQQTPTMMMNMEGSSSQPPNSFTMTVLNGQEPNVGSSAPMQPSSSMMSMDMMEMPSMTMTIQPADATTTTSIELSSSNSANATSGALIRMPPNSPVKEAQFVEQQQQDNWSSDAGGQHYYSSPWVTRRPPLTSPAKFLRGERLRDQSLSQLFRPSQQEQQQQLARQKQQPPRQTNQQQQLAKSRPPIVKVQPIVVIKNQWSPSQQSGKNRIQNERIEQQQVVDLDDFVPIGPPQLMPIYQTPNGQFHMTPPPMMAGRQTSSSSTTATTTPTLSFEHEDSPATGVDNAEVQTIGDQNNRQPSSKPSISTVADATRPDNSDSRPDFESRGNISQNGPKSGGRQQIKSNNLAQKTQNMRQQVVSGGY